MKVNLTREIFIAIDEINVEDGEYEIHYRYTIDNGEEQSDVYGSDFDGWTIKEWEKELKDGAAMNIITQQVAENLE